MINRIFIVTFLLKACEKARMSSGAIHLESDYFFHDVNAMEKIDKLKDDALLKISSQSGMYFEHLVPENFKIIC